MGMWLLLDICTVPKNEISQNQRKKWQIQVWICSPGSASVSHEWCICIYGHSLHCCISATLNIKCSNHSEKRVTRVREDLAGSLRTESCIKNASSLTPKNPPSQLQLLTYLLLALLKQGSWAWPVPIGQIWECSSEAKWGSLWQVYTPVGSHDHLRFF